MPESATPDELVGIVVSNKVVDADDPLPVTIAGQAAGASAVKVADGSDVAEGATTDAAVITDANGTISGKLRGLVKIFADIWDSTNHALYVRFKTGSTVTQFAARSSDLAITASAGRLHGFSIAETTGSATAKAYIRDGTDGTGSILSVITLAPNESARDYFGDRGLAVATGIYLDWISGTIEGAVYSGPA